MTDRHPSSSGPSREVDPSQPQKNGAQPRRRALVVGSGAREHALARALVRSGVEVIAAPGNPGIARLATVVEVAVDDVPALVALAVETAVDLVVIGPERPLTLGLADALREKTIAAFGPGRAAAELEGSKAFMKEFLKRHGIPTADFRVFDDLGAARDYVVAENRPLVVKADGLAAGKGVVVAGSVEEATAAVESMMKQRVFGDAGARVVIEDVLPGEEASFHLVVHVGGERAGTSENQAADWAYALAAAQDHKRVFAGDRGPNTGGMGAYAPAPVVTPEVLARVEERIVGPTLRGLAADGLDFRGVLFIGLMIDGGQPSVLEFNVRFGDPEATVILPLLGENAWNLLYGAATGAKPGFDLDATSHAALAVVLAAEHYPATPTTGDAIEGADHAAAVAGAFVHHAGTRLHEGALITAGGRVLTVSGEGADLAEAHARAYQAASQLYFRGMHYRRDIGYRALGTGAEKD